MKVGEIWRAIAPEDGRNDMFWIFKIIQIVKVGNKVFNLAIKVRFEDGSPILDDAQIKIFDSSGYAFGIYGGDSYFKLTSKYKPGEKFGLGFNFPANCIAGLELTDTKTVKSVAVTPCVDNTVPTNQDKLETIAVWGNPAVKPGEPGVYKVQSSRALSGWGWCYFDGQQWGNGWTMFEEAAANLKHETVKPMKNVAWRGPFSSPIE